MNYPLRVHIQTFTDIAGHSGSGGAITSNRSGNPAPSKPSEQPARTMHGPTDSTGCSTLALGISFIGPSLWHSVLRSICGSWTALARATSCLLGPMLQARLPAGPGMRTSRIKRRRLVRSYLAGLRVETLHGFELEALSWLCRSSLLGFLAARSLAACRPARTASSEESCSLANAAVVSMGPPRA